MRGKAGSQCQCCGGEALWLSDAGAKCAPQCALSPSGLPLPPPPAAAAGVFKFDFEEEQDLDEAAVRRMVWDEMAHYDS